MHALLPRIKEVLRGMWQGRWVGLVVAWLAGIGGTVYVFTKPDRYEANARVYVDTQSVLQPLLSGLAIPPNVDQEVALLSRTLISRPNLQKLVRMTDLDLQVKTADERERLIDELTRRLYIRGVGQANLYMIGYTDEVPAQAARVVQSLLSIFVESGLAAKSTDTGQARRFIEEQIKAYEHKLAEAEARVKEFKLRNMELNAADGADFFGSLAGVAQQLRQAQLSLAEAQRSRDALRDAIAGEEKRPAEAAAPEAPPAVTTPEMDARIAGLNKSLDDMLLRYTDNHPDVINARRIIREVEAQRDEERRRLTEELQQRRRAEAVPGVRRVDPQLRLALAEAEAQVAAMQARASDYERRLNILRQRARTVPEHEAEFAALNRDYAIQKQNYESLVARRESASMSAEMGAATGFADFRIIDPPRVSPTPVAPNRQMLIPLTLLAALGAGIGAAYLFSLVHPTFHENRALKRVGLRPVLGAVSLIENPEIAARRRRLRLVFLGGLGGVAATYSAAVAAVFLRHLLPF